MGAMDSYLHHLPAGSRPVVVGVDGSSDSTQALLWAAVEAAQRGVPLRIVAAWVVPALAFTTPVVPPTFVDPTIFEAAAEEIVTEAAETVRTRLGAGAPAVETIAVAGEPATVLSERSRHAEVLVVGSHGRGSVARAVLGSVAERCLALSSVPVVVVGEQASAPADGPVVVGVEDTPAARDALRWAVLEAGRLGRRLVVVHAHEVDSVLRPDLAELPPDVDEVTSKNVRRFLDHLLTEVAVIGGRPRSVAWRVVVGDATHRLVEASADASMLVVGTPRPHGLVERMVGSTGRHCVRTANCPVVVVPAAAIPEVDGPVLECAS